MKKAGVLTQDFNFHSRRTDKNGQLGFRTVHKSSPYSLLLCIYTLPDHGRLYFWLESPPLHGLGGVGDFENFKISSCKISDFPGYKGQLELRHNHNFPD